MDGASPPSKRMKYDLTRSFQVLVGTEPDQQSFTVHTDLAIQRSEFFNAARSSRWTEWSKPTVLDDHDPVIFSAYLHCLYFGAAGLRDVTASSISAMRKAEAEAETVSDANDSSDEDGETSNEGGEISSSNVSNKASNDGSNGSDKASNDGNDGSDYGTDRSKEDDDGDEEWEENNKVIDRYRFLSELYFLADKLMDPTSANLAIDEMIRFAQESHFYPSLNIVRLIYKSTPRGSPLRKLVRDWHIHHIEGHWVDSFEIVDHPLHFVQDILHKVWALNRENPDMRIRDVYTEAYINDPGDRYHQRIVKVPERATTRNAEDQIEDVKKDA